MRVEYHPETVEDLNKAIDFYEQRQEGLGIDLREEIYQSIDHIIANPFIYREVEGKIRRCFVHRFPFSILYRITDDDVVRILVIRHHRQHPEFGLSRE